MSELPELYWSAEHRLIERAEDGGFAITYAIAKIDKGD